MPSLLREWWVRQNIMKIKVCGITTTGQLEELNRLDIDYAGLIFYERSPRYVLTKLKSKEVASLELKTKKVGVFVNASEGEIMTQIELYELDVVQLHGNETPTFCNHISNHVKVIKAFRINEENSHVDWMVKPYEESCDFYLFDHGSMGIYGGTGKKFNWSLLENATVGKSFFLSGGIRLGDAESIKNFKHPFFYAVDINSQFEAEPGVKDINLVKEFKASIT
ncbi:MAG: phosphoribosylanthranilate isomerase [Ginsengibacter sp.]